MFSHPDFLKGIKTSLLFWTQRELRFPTPIS